MTATPLEQRPDELQLTDIVAFFARHWKLIFGLPAAVGVVALAVGLFLLPPRYEATATILVVPPTFTSELRPPTLTVQGYQRVLESQTVIEETRQHLVKKGVLSPTDRLELGTGLRTRIFVSRRAESSVLAPVIEAVARAHVPEDASEIVNAWVQEFMQHASRLTGNTMDSSVKVVLLMDRNFLSGVEPRFTLLGR